MPRRVVVFLIAVIASVAATAAPAGAAEHVTPDGVPVPALDWRPCEDGFDCATASVPQDNARPGGAKVRLALIRHAPSTMRPLFLNPGGPGGSGVELVRTAHPVAVQLLSRVDWVGFDLRGVGERAGDRLRRARGAVRADDA